MSKISNEDLVTSASETITSLSKVTESLKSTKSNLTFIVNAALSLANHIRNLNDHELGVLLNNADYRFLSRIYFPDEVELAIDPAQNAINTTEKKIKAFEEMLNSLQTQLGHITSKKKPILCCLSSNPRDNLLLSINDSKYALEYVYSGLKPKLDNAFAAYQKHIVPTADYFKFDLNAQMISAAEKPANLSKA